MQKTTSVFLGALVLVVTGLVVWGGRPRASPAVQIPALSSSVPEQVEPMTSLDAGSVPDMVQEASFSGVRGAKPGYVMLDGSKPPDLSPEAPRSVRFGVVLVQYRGAEHAPLGARSKMEALKTAHHLLEVAKNDFAAAVAQGDAGSTAAAGWMPRRVLEPAPEYVLFTTPPGEVAGPIDTPTGYWIVKNIGKNK